MSNFRIRHKIIAYLTDINIIGIRALVNFLPYILIPKPSKKLIVSTLYGFKMEIDPVKDNKGLEKVIYYTGTYEKGTLHIIKNILNSGSVFVDIGANIGLMSVFSSILVQESGKIFSFEPNPATYDILKKNIELNNLSNINAEPLGIGSVKKTTKIYDQWDSGRGSASMIKPEHVTNSYDVEVVTLSDYFNDFQNDIDVIKIDIEGYELEALRGAEKIIREKLPVLIIEISDNRMNFEEANGTDIMNYVLSFKKYKVFKLNGSKKRSSKLVEVTLSKELPQHDNIFCISEERIARLPKGIFLN